MDACDDCWLLTPRSFKTFGEILSVLVFMGKSSEKAFGKKERHENKEV
jgi:hypothetical protein